MLTFQFTENAVETWPWLVVWLQPHSTASMEMTLKISMLTSLTPLSPVFSPAPPLLSPLFFFKYIYSTNVSKKFPTSDIMLSITRWGWCRGQAWCNHSKQLLLSKAGSVLSQWCVLMMETVTLSAKTWMIQYLHCKEKSDIYSEMTLQWDSSITYFWILISEFIPA